MIGPICDMHDCQWLGPWFMAVIMLFNVLFCLAFIEFALVKKTATVVAFGFLCAN